MKPFPCLCCLAVDSERCSWKHNCSFLAGSGWTPRFGGSCKIFTLDYCSSYGHVCLIYNNEQTATDRNGTETARDLYICALWLGTQLYIIYKVLELVVKHFNTGSDSCVSGELWLLDLSLSWHFLSSTFSDYFRLAVVHLGLTQWPYVLTRHGLSPQCEVCVCEVGVCVWVGECGCVGVWVLE